MTILFLSYWGVNEGLTVATVFPHLKILAAFPDISKIIFCTIEREDAEQQAIDVGIDKVTHVPLQSVRRRFNLLTKFDDFTVFPKRLVELIHQEKVDQMICRGTPAGALGYLVARKTKVPYYVESFEPHADYMLESAVWKAYDPRFLLQKYWEMKQLKTAKGVMPVAENYTKALIDQGVLPEKVKTAPCAVPVERFRFDEEKRLEMRARLDIPEGTKVGIYVGKFGSIYYDHEAFELFKAAFDYYKGAFHLIILTPESAGLVYNRCAEFGIPDKYVSVTLAAHQEVPAYLAAADFAFSTIKPAKSRKYCSPIKNGEYWANGLPVILTDGVGDDDDIIRSEKAGAVFQPDQGATFELFDEIELVLKESEHRYRIQQLAKKYRSFDQIKAAYQSFLSVS